MNMSPYASFFSTSHAMKYIKIVIGVDQASLGLGQAHQWGFYKDLDWILACENLHMQ